MMGNKKERLLGFEYQYRFMISFVDNEVIKLSYVA